MNGRTCVLCILLVLTGTSLWAQEGEPDPIAVNTFEPELVMRSQLEISLTEEQRGNLKKEIQQAQAKFTELEWDLERDMASLVSLIEKERVDEQRAIEILRKVLALESEIKQTHLLLAVRIKNLLTPEQQARLREIRMHR